MIKKEDLQDIPKVFEYARAATYQNKDALISLLNYEQDLMKRVSELLRKETEITPDTKE